MEWYEQLDFDENPLHIDTKYVGNPDTLDETFYSIVAGSILVLEGEAGSGKTKVLREVIKKFGGYGRIAYINCQKLESKLNVEHIITKKNGFFGWLFKKYPKNMVLLLDDVEHLSQRNLERIKYFFDRNYLRSVIIATTDYESLKLPESLQQRVRKVIKIGTLSNYEAVQVIQDRIGKDMLPDRVIKEAYQEADKNMKKFLQNCEEICKVKVQDKKKEITEADVKTILAREAK